MRGRERIHGLFTDVSQALYRWCGRAMVYLNDVLMKCVVGQFLGYGHGRLQATSSYFFWLKEFGMYISLGMLAVIVMIAYILGIVTAVMMYSWQDRDE